MVDLELTVLLSCAAEDAERGRLLAGALAERGVPAVSARTLGRDADLKTSVEAAIDRAAVVLALFTEVAWSSEFVIAEATRATEQAKLISVDLGGGIDMDPARFGRSKAFDLKGWDNDPNDERLDELAEFIEMVRPRRSQPDQVDWQPDEPAVVDALGRESVAEALATQLRRLADAYPGYPFLVHIDGRWGSGKSTLLGFVRRFVATPLEKPTRRDDGAIEPADDAWLVVDYDAWRQSKVGPPWLTMLNALRDVVFTRQSWWRRQWLRAAETRRLVGSSTWLSVISWTFIAAISVTLFVVLVSGGNTSQVNDVVKLVGGVLGLAATAWALSTAASSHVLLRSRRAAERFETLHSDPMEELATHFQWVLRQSPANVVFLIDDLDRCDHHHVVELLESVQKLMRDRSVDDRSGQRNLFFTVAADGRWIRESFQTRYEIFADAVGEAGRSIGTLFLDKLFQLTMSLPELHEALQQQYLRSLVDQRAAVSSDDDEDADVPEPAEPTAELKAQLGVAVGEKEVLDVLATATPLERIQAVPLAIERLLTNESVTETEHRLQPFAPLLDKNPRSMKRFVMAYSMLRIVRTAEANIVPLEPLALWTIIVTRWPGLADVLGRNPSAVRYFWVPVEDQPAEIPAGVRPLFADPPEDLRRVMNDPDTGPLDPDTIRRCCGLAPVGGEGALDA